MVRGRIKDPIFTCDLMTCIGPVRPQGWLAGRQKSRISRSVKMGPHAKKHPMPCGSVQFSSVPWPAGSSGGHEGRFSKRSSSSLFCRRPLWAVLALTGMSTLWWCPFSISAADHGVAHPPRCPEGWFWRDCYGVWHAQTTKVSVSLQLPDEVPVDPQGSRSCSAPSRWACG